MDLPTRVLEYVRRHKLVEPGSTVLLGISGGPDSVALARLMQQLRHELCINLEMAHYNHQVRPTAGRDERFVRDLARKMNVPVTIERRKRVSQGRLSENQARQLRLEFFRRLLIRKRAQSIALAHTCDDAAETVLMRLLRGSGLQGLRGILPQRQVQGLPIIRPLLAVSRPQVLEYLHGQKLKYCIDETNRQAVFLRNKIRLKLLPLLSKEYNPNIRLVLNDLAQSAADDYDFLQMTAAQRIKENVVSSKTTVTMGLDFLRQQHPALLRLVLREAFARLTGDTKQLEFQHVTQVQQLLLQPPGSTVHWPRSIAVKRQKSNVVFRLCAASS